jgi:hypothetical protein
MLLLNPHDMVWTKRILSTLLLGIAMLWMATGAREYTGRTSLAEQQHMMVADQPHALYTAVANVYLEYYADVMDVDCEGNIALKQKLPTGAGFFAELDTTSNGRLLLIDGVTTPYVSLYSVNTSRSFEKTQELNDPEAHLCFSADNQYAVSETWEANPRLVLYRLYGSRLHRLHEIHVGDRFGYLEYSRESRRFIISNHTTDKTLDVYRITPVGHLEAEGPAASYYPAQGNQHMGISPDGRTCVVLSTNHPAITVFRINADATINKVQDFSPSYYAAPWIADFTPDSRYALIIYPGGSPWPYHLESYRINGDGSLTRVDALGDMELAQSLSISPDGNFALVSHHYYSDGQQTLSPIRIHHDGTLTRLIDKDLIMMGHFIHSRFIPPQVIEAYGVCEDEAERPVYMETFADWQGGSVPGVFDVPESWVMPDGSLALRPTSTTNCFGFWQSPLDALMVVPYSVYRARFAVRASNAGSPGGPEPILPTLRLRTNAQTLQQADTLVLNSTPGGFLKTTEDEEPTTFTLVFEPPISSCSREEEMDDVFCSLDLMAFNAEDDLATTYVLSQMLVDRLPVECFDVDQVVCDYEFTEDEEGWTYGGAPATFSLPHFEHVPGALLISAQGKTNCFGFWNSDPADAVTTSGEALYRATFYVRTNQPDRWRVPTFRLRLGTSRSELITTHEIISANDSEMSPYYDSTDPAYQFEYPVYLYKPETAEPLNLLLAFDLLNFDETDDANTLLILDRVRLERLTLPTFPLDD